METEASPATPASKRPRPILFVMLGVLVAAFLWMQLGGSTVPPPPSSNPTRTPPPAGGAGGAGGGSGEQVDPAGLAVNLESLSKKRQDPGEAERDPFRFKPKPMPAPVPMPPVTKPPVDSGPVEPSKPVVPAPPPITVKYIGKFDMPDGTTRAVFTDCTTGRRTGHYREGDSVLGQYRLVKIGVTSVVIEHLDGRGRTTLALSGQECVWK